MSQTGLVCVYDLNVCPATFDCLKFLAMAELYAEKNQYGYLEYVIVSYDHEVRKVLHSDHENRVKNIIIPIFQNFSRSGNCFYLDERAEASHYFNKKKKEEYHFFPEVYDIENPLGIYQISDMMDMFEQWEEWPSLQLRKPLNKLKLSAITPFANKKRIVSITLRECDYQVERNSLREDWIKFIHSLEGDCSVIVFDGNRVDWELPDYCFRWNGTPSVIERYTVYQLSDINYFVNTGPMALCHLTDSKFLIFKMVVPNSKSASPEFFERSNFPLLSQYPWCDEQQKIIWADDLFCNLKFATNIASAEGFERLAKIEEAILANRDNDGMFFQILSVALSFYPERTDWLKEWAVRALLLGKKGYFFSALKRMYSLSDRVPHLDLFTNQNLLVAIDKDMVWDFFKSRQFVMPMSKNFLSELETLNVWGVGSKTHKLLDDMGELPSGWRFYDRKCRFADFNGHSVEVLDFEIILHTNGPILFVMEDPRDPIRWMLESGKHADDLFVLLD